LLPQKLPCAENAASKLLSVECNPQKLPYAENALETLLCGICSLKISSLQNMLSQKIFSTDYAALKTLLCRIICLKTLLFGVICLKNSSLLSNLPQKLFSAE